MRKTIATAVLVPVCSLVLVGTAEARQTLFPNPVTVSGDERTGRMVATCKNLKGLGWGERRTTDIRVQRLERTVRKGVSAVQWIDFTAPPGGKKVSAGAFDAHWTASVYPGVYRTRCREIVYVNGIPRFGKFVDSPKTEIRAKGW